MKKNGFVFMETLIVVSVLTITLTLLYTSYSYILTKTRTNNTYDTEETIYKTYNIEMLMKNAKGSDGNAFKTVDNFMKKVCKQMKTFESYKCDVENATSDASLLPYVYQMKYAYEVSKLYYVNPYKLLTATDSDSTHAWILLFDATTIDYIKHLGKSVNQNVLIIKYKKTYNNNGGYDIVHSSDAEMAVVS